MHNEQTLSEQKRAIRRDILKARSELSHKQRKAASERLRDNALEISQITAAHAIAGYWPIRGEIDVMPLLMALRDRDIKIFLPVLISKTELEFRRFDTNTRLVDNSFGISAPDKKSPVGVPDVFLVPLAAFDRTGYRIGYGGGYYDRALAKHSGGALRESALRVGVAFSMQEVERVPRGTHDIPMDVIVTQDKTLWIP